MSARCLHCEISSELMPHFQGRPALENVSRLCEVIADTAASAPPDGRALFCARAQTIFATMMREVVDGSWKTGPDTIHSEIPPVRVQ